MHHADVAVIGGGPAGIAAALAASESGARVILVDEYARPGGQYFKRAAAAFSLGSGSLSREHARGEALRAALTASPVELLVDTIAWGIFGRTVMLYRDGRSSALHAKAIVVATGAYDRPVAFPGWTLPGVMSAGGAQTIARTQWVQPGRRVLIAGAGPFVMPVADQILRAGAHIVAIAEATRPREWLRHARSLWGQWPRFAEFFGYWKSLRHVPVLYGHKIARALGTDGVELAEICAIDSDWHAVAGSTRRLEVDAVATAYGFLPNTEVADAGGCALAWDPPGRAWFVKCDERMETSVKGVFAAGEVTGIGGSAIALEEGRLAGIGAAESVGVLATREAQRLREGPAARRARLMHFASALNELFAPREGLWQGLEDGTTVCRCEDVTASEIRRCVQAGCATVKGIKDWTRAGMGPCQGRVCRNLVATVCAEGGAALDALSRPRIRPPFKPVPFEAIATTELADVDA